MKPDVRALRELHLPDVMQSLGYQPTRRSGGSLEYRLDDGRKLSVTPRPRNAKSGSLSMFQVWNGEAMAGRNGGAGAVDLVIAVAGRTFPEALVWLRNAFSNADSDPPGAPPSDVSHRPPPVDHTLPVRHHEALGAVQRYLCAKRSLPPTLVVPLLSAGIIYPHIHRYEGRGGTPRSFVNAVFVMRDDRSLAPTGAMIRGCYDGTNPRKSTLPLQPDSSAAFWVGASLDSARSVVLTESPIECLSWMAVHKTHEGVHCRTYGGNRWRLVKSIFAEVAARDIPLVCAFNNDTEGARASDGLAELANKDHVRLSRQMPDSAKDWNDILRRRGKNGSDLPVDLAD